MPRHSVWPASLSRRPLTVSPHDVKITVRIRGRRHTFTLAEATIPGVSVWRDFGEIRAAASHRMERFLFWLAVKRFAGRDAVRVARGCLSPEHAFLELVRACCASSVTTALGREIDEAYLAVPDDDREAEAVFARSVFKSKAWRQAPWEVRTAWTRRTIDGVDIDAGEVEAKTARLALREVRRLCWGGPSCGSPNGVYTKAERNGEVLEIQEVKP